MWSWLNNKQQSNVQPSNLCIWPEWWRSAPACPSLAAAPTSMLLLLLLLWRNTPLDSSTTTMLLLLLLCQAAHWLCLCSMLLYRFVDEYPCCSIMLWLWTMRTNYMLQAQGLMLMLHTLILQISKCGKCFKCDLCIFKCTCPCIGPPADMHLCRRVLGRQICRVHMCPGHSVPDTCVGYTDTCSLISHLWHFRTITIKIRSTCIVWLIQT